MTRRLLVVSLLVLALVSFGLTAQLAGAQSPANNTVTVAAGQSTRVPAMFWCLDFGKPFPTAVNGPASRAPDPVLKVLAAAPATTDPYQMQLAVWHQADGVWHDVAGRGTDTANSIINTSANLSVAAPSGAVTLDQAVKNNQATVAIEGFQAVNDTGSGNVPPYSGKGTLVITNSGSAPLTLVVNGSVFQPTGGANAQTLVAQQVAQTATATATAATTSTVAPAAQVTAEPTTAATAAPTTAATIAAAAQVTAAPTTVATVAPTATPTTAPTMTPTTAPTMAPTTAPTAAATLAPAATVTPSTLPVTGGSSNSGLLAVFMLGLGVLSLGTGLRLAMARRNVK